MDWIWDSKTLLSALDLGPSAPADWPQFSITSVNIIPEECSPGSLFVSSPFELKNRGFGNEEDALKSAIAHGASAAITNLGRLSFSPGVPVISLNPPLAGLVKLARFARASYRGKVIAITGSVGKTTTKDLLHHVLSSDGLSFKSAETRNALGGICELIINRPLQSQFSIVEVGASRPGHMRHASVARPHIGIVTNIGVSHKEHYSDPDGIFREKISLLDHLEGERIGVVHGSILDADDVHDGLIRSKRLGRLVTVGNGPGSDVFLVEAVFNGAVSEGTMSVFGTPYPFRLSLPGRHFIENAMFAIGVGSVIGLDVHRLISSLATASPSPGRLTRYRIQNDDGVIELIDDSFNAASIGRRIAGYVETA